MNEVYSIEEDNRFFHLITNPSVANLGKAREVREHSILYRAYKYFEHVETGDGKRPFCPFVKMVSDSNGYHVRICTESPADDDLLSIMEGMKSMFHKISPALTHKDQPVDTTTIAVVFSAPEADSEVFFQTFARITAARKEYFCSHGLMMGYMHPFHSFGGTTKRGQGEMKESPLYVSGVPLLMLRRMHRQDFAFMGTDKLKEIYKGFFPDVSSSCPVPKSNTDLLITEGNNFSFRQTYTPAAGDSLVLRSALAFENEIEREEFFTKFAVAKETKRIY